jgi:hypothetical protein
MNPGTRLFVYEKTDLALSDVIPLVLKRTTCDVKPFRHVRKNGKVWIPKHSITTICLPISPAEHPTYIKEAKGGRRSTPLDVKFPSWT